MTIDIEKHNHLYKVIGRLEQQNIKEFKRKFKDIWKKSDSITICIENVKCIDQYGVAALTQLYNEALAKQKRLSFVGIGCKDLYEHFNTKEKQL